MHVCTYIVHALYIQEHFCSYIVHILYRQLTKNVDRRKSAAETPSGFLPNADIGVCAPISVYSDIDTDIGADFNDTRYRVHPISAYTRYRVYPISVNTRYRVSRYRVTYQNIPISGKPISGIPDIGIPDIGYTPISA